MPKIQKETFIVTTTERPDLVPLVARWLWAEFWRSYGFTLEEMQVLVAASADPTGIPRCFVLLADGKPVGTASLVTHDLDERPNLTPWLAGVYVTPEARGRGYVNLLLDAADDACVRAGIATVWLYTNTAERVYQRARWRTVETVERTGRPAVALMRRDLPSFNAH